MSSLFWGYSGGYGRVSEVAANAGRAEAQADRANREVASLEDRIDHLTLLNMAMWSLLQEKTGLTEQDLLDRVRQIDLQDGVEDGKARKQIAKCPKCGRTMSPRHRRCLYCGAGDLNYTAFDSVR